MSNRAIFVLCTGALGMISAASANGEGSSPHRPVIRVVTERATYTMTRSTLARQAAGGKTINISQGLSGDLLDLAVAPGQIYVATGDGLFTSLDFGFTWVRKVLPDALAPTVVEAGKSGPLIVGTEAGLYLSTDGGANWALGESTSGRAVYALLRLGGAEGDLLAATDEGILASTDSGQTWTRLWPAEGSAAAIGLHRLGDSEALALGTAGAAVIGRSGDEWQISPTITRGLDFSDGKLAPLARCEEIQQPSLLGNTPGALARLGYGSASKPAVAPSPLLIQSHKPRLPTRTIVACSPESGGDVAGERYELVRRRNSRESHFRPLASPVFAEDGTGAAIWPLREHARGDVVVVAQAGKLLTPLSASDGGRSWRSGQAWCELIPSRLREPVRSGTQPALTVYLPNEKIAKVSPTSLIRLHLEPFVEKSYYWTGGRGYLYSECAQSPHDPQSVFCLGDPTSDNRPDSSVFRSANGGASFKPMARIFGLGIAVSPSDPNVIYAGNSVSTDGGWTWKSHPGTIDEHAGVPALLAVTQDGRAIVDRSPGKNLRHIDLIGPKGDVQRLTRYASRACYMRRTGAGGFVRCSLARVSDPNRGLWLALESTGPEGAFIMPGIHLVHCPSIPSEAFSSFRLYASGEQRLPWPGSGNTDAPPRTGTCEANPLPVGIEHITSMLPSTQVETGLYVGTRGYGLLYTPDAGRSWHRADDLPGEPRPQAETALEAAAEPQPSPAFPCATLVAHSRTLTFEGEENASEAKIASRVERMCEEFDPPHTARKCFFAKRRYEAAMACFAKLAQRDGGPSCEEVGAWVEKVLRKEEDGRPPDNDKGRGPMPRRQTPEEVRRSLEIACGLQRFPAEARRCLVKAESLEAMKPCLDSVKRKKRAKRMPRP